MPIDLQHRRVGNEPDWRLAKRHTTALLPPPVRGWLLDDGSLTERLRGLGQFAVVRRYQGWQVALPTEQSLLDQPTRALALVREVALLLDGQPVVFARSVFPAASLTGELSHLRYLRSRSLGTILFRHPAMRRSPFEIAHVPGDCDYLPGDLRQRTPAWGRRSRFEIRGKKLMVSEIFLQGFRPWRALLPVHRTQRGRVRATVAHQRPLQYTSA